jgi:hypothetical protein
MASLEIIKHIFNYTDKELMEQFYLSYQVLYARGIRNMGRSIQQALFMVQKPHRMITFINERRKASISINNERRNNEQRVYC